MVGYTQLLTSSMAGLRSSGYRSRSGVLAMLLNSLQATQRIITVIEITGDGSQLHVSYWDCWCLTVPSRPAPRCRVQHLYMHPCYAPTPLHPPLGPSLCVSICSALGSASTDRQKPMAALKKANNLVADVEAAMMAYMEVQKQAALGMLPSITYLVAQ